jgi:hypothetical protein
MNKSKQNKTNVLDNLGKHVEKMVDLYEDQPVPQTQIKPLQDLEKDLKMNEIQKQVVKYSPNKVKPQTWDVMKAAAKAEAKKGNYKELRELRKIERKHNKKSYTEDSGSTKQPIPDTQVPMEFNVPMFPLRETVKDDTLQKLEAERKKIDPDLFKGLGIFLSKKI